MKTTAVAVSLLLVWAGCRPNTGPSTPAGPFRPLLAREFFPAQVFFTPVGKDTTTTVISIRESEVSLEEFWGGTKHLAARIPLDVKHLNKILIAIHRDDLLGVARYSHPRVRDGYETRIVTPLGQITLYGVLDTHGQPALELPTHVTRLGPLVAYAHDCWRLLHDKHGTPQVELPKLDPP